MCSTRTIGNGQTKLNPIAILGLLSLFELEQYYAHFHAYFTLMIDGDKKVVSKQPFASFPKVNSLQS